jgi:hypothetical protein
VTDLAAPDLATPDLSVPALDLAPVDYAVTPDASGASTCDALAGQVALCEGFESGFLNPQVWSAVVDHATLSDSSFAYRGAHSLHIQTQWCNPADASVEARIIETRTFPPQTDTYVRLWAYFPRPDGGAPMGIAPDHLIGPELANGTSNYPDYNLFTGTNQPDNSLAFELHDTVSGMSQPSTTPITPPFGAWFCLQFHVQLGDASTGLIEFAVNGTGYQWKTATIPTQAFTSLRIGPYYSQFPLMSAVPPFDLWIDEIIVDSKPVSWAE